MAVTGVKPYNTFVKGFNTESNPLAFPRDFSRDELNCNISADGSRRRRLGVEPEISYSLTASTIKTAINHGSVTAFVWDAPDNNGELSILVVQFGRVLHFYKMVKDKITGNKYAGTIDLNTHKVSYSRDVGHERVQMTSGLGYLIVVSNEIEPIYVTFDSTTEAFTSTAITINIRDVIGLDDGFEVDEEVAQGSRTAAKDYNLLNQGWTEANIDAVITGSSGNLPKNSDIQYLGKNSSGSFAYSTLDQQFFGNTPAPKGKYIVNAFYIDRSTIADPDTTEDVSGITIEETNSRPSTVEFMSGRVWYAGQRHPNIPTRIYFSQVLTNVTKIGNCHAEADPTSEHNSDLVDTDGGYITLPEAGKVHKLLTFSSTILVFAENGVWQIRGGENGFTSTSFFTSRINDIGSVGGFSITEAEGTVMYWADGGIYQLSVDTLSGELTVGNISEATIQTFYNDIPKFSRENCVAVYDNIGKKAYWFYNDSPTLNPLDLRNKFTNVLFYDTRAQGFYKYEVSATNEIFMSAPFVDNEVHVEKRQQNLVNSRTEEVLTDADGEAIFVPTSYEGASQYKLKFVIIKCDVSEDNYELTVGQFSSSTFLDWNNLLDTPVDYTSYLLGGPDTNGNFLSNKLTAVLYIMSQKSETGYAEDVSTGELQLENQTEINYRYRYNWSDGNGSEQWSSLRSDGYVLPRYYIPSGSADAFDTGDTLINTQQSTRGSGDAFQLYLESSTGKEMHLYAWAALIQDSQSS